MATSQAPSQSSSDFLILESWGCLYLRKSQGCIQKIKELQISKGQVIFCLMKITFLISSSNFIVAYAYIQSLKKIITFFKRKPSNFEPFMHRDFVLLLTSTEWELADDCLWLYYTLKMAQFATSLSSAEYCNSAQYTAG